MDFSEMCIEFATVSTNLHVDITTFDEQRIKDVLNILVGMKDALKRKEYREIIGEDTLVQLCSCFKHSMKQCKEGLDYVGVTHGTGTALSAFLDLATESARCLRNSCASHHDNQQTVAKQTDIYEILHNTVQSCCRYINESVTAVDRSKVKMLLRSIVQLLGNLAVGNTQTSSFIFSCFFDLFSKLLQLRDGPLSSYTCMLIHSCSLMHSTLCLNQLVDTPAGQSLVSEVLKCLGEADTEWGLFIIEWMLTSSRLLENIWSHLEVREQNLLLDVIVNQLDESSHTSADRPTVATETIHFILDAFKSKASVILGLNNSTSITKEESSLVSKQLNILCAVTTKKDWYSDILQDQDLLKYTVNLLHCMKMIGEQGNNLFSPVRKVSELGDADTDHPVCGLKRDLIRLIANMAYKNKKNQDKVRELGGINLIMDHTNIDGRNPFITQWSVFAIHNLLEGNSDNQAVIAGMRLEGLADNVNQLREFGVEAELDGDRIVIRNVNASQPVSPFSKAFKNER